MYIHLIITMAVFLTGFIITRKNFSKHLMILAIISVLCSITGNVVMNTWSYNDLHTVTIKESLYDLKPYIILDSTHYFKSDTVSSDEGLAVSLTRVNNKEESDKFKEFTHKEWFIIDEDSTDIFQIEGNYTREVNKYSIVYSDTIDTPRTYILYKHKVSDKWSTGWMIPSTKVDAVLEFPIEYKGKL